MGECSLSAVARFEGRGAVTDSCATSSNDWSASSCEYKFVLSDSLIRFSLLLLEKRVKIVFH